MNTEKNKSESREELGFKDKVKKWFNIYKIKFDRSFSGGITKQLVWLGGFMLVLFVILVLISYMDAAYSEHNVFEHMRDVFYILLDPGNYNKEMSTPIIITCAIVGLVVFSGMLISVISNVLNRRVDSFTNGNTDYAVRNHHVVIGFNKSVPSLLKKINDKYPESYIVLMSSRDTNEIRNWIHANVSASIENRLILLRGEMLSKDDLERLYLRNNVRKIYVLGEEGLDEHDAVNMRCVELLAKKMKGCDNVNCHVQIDSHVMFSVLQTVDKGKDLSPLRFYPFNFNEIIAQNVIATMPGDKYLPLDGKGITASSTEHVHLIIVGMNEMGQALAINAAHVLHFPNFVEGDISTCSHITFIDNNAHELGLEFRCRLSNLFALVRWRSLDGATELNGEDGWVDSMQDKDFPYKHLGTKNFMDIKWEFIKGDVYDDNIQRYLRSCSLDKNEVTTIALCDDNSPRNAAFCMGLSEDIRVNAHQILVRQKDTSVTIDLLQQMPGFSNVHSFGRMDKCYNKNLISDKFGKLINACYGKYDDKGNKIEIDIIDAAAVNDLWGKTSLLNRWSSIYCANMLFYKFRSMGIETNEIDAQMIDKAFESLGNQELTRLEHNRWNTEKLLLGFRPLKEEELALWDNGEKKRLKEEKKHKDIRPFSDLGKKDTDKDDDVNKNLYKLYLLTPVGKKYAKKH